jgi:hypothetical protein
LRTKLAVLVIVISTVVLLSTAAHAGSEAALTLSPTSGPPGTQVTGTTTCDPDSGNFTLIDPNNEQFGETTDFAGTEFVVTIPENAVPGTWTFRLQCTMNESPIIDDDPFEVTPAPPAPPGPPSPPPPPAEAAVPAPARPAFTG